MWTTGAVVAVAKVVAGVATVAAKVGAKVMVQLLLRIVLNTQFWLRLMLMLNTPVHPICLLSAVLCSSRICPDMAGSGIMTANVNGTKRLAPSSSLDLRSRTGHVFRAGNVLSSAERVLV